MFACERELRGLDTKSSTLSLLVHDPLRDPLDPFIMTTPTHPTAGNLPISSNARQWATNSNNDTMSRRK